MKKVEIPSDIMKMAISLKSFGIDGYAWRARDALVVISYLSEQNAVILGGDVYKIKLRNIAFKKEIKALAITMRFNFEATTF